MPIATLPENLVIVGHCYGPINPHGDDRIPLIRFMHYEEGSIPAQGLPSSQFCTDGMVATSETLVDSLVTQQLGLWMTGSTGFNGDYIIDVENGKAYIGHCECPLNPYGDERRALM